MTRIRAGAIAVLLGIALIGVFSTRLGDESGVDDVGDETAQDHAGIAESVGESTDQADANSGSRVGVSGIDDSDASGPERADSEGVELYAYTVAVREARERGVEGVTVALRGEIEFSGVTDEEGSFDVEAPAGKYILTATHPTFATFEEEVWVEENATKQIKLPNLTITGVVRGRGEQIPIERLQIGIRIGSEQGNTEHERSFIRTGGEFLVSWNRPEYDELVAWAPGYERAYFSIDELRREGDQLHASIELEPSPGIYGTVMDEDRKPIPGASVFIDSANHKNTADDVAEGFSDANGEFRIRKPHQPANFIVADHKDFAPGYTVYRDSLPTSGYEVFLLPKAQVSGRVRAGDDPIAGQTIEAFFLDSYAVGKWSSETDNDGYYLIDGLPPGELTVQWKVSKQPEFDAGAYHGSKTWHDRILAPGEEMVQDFTLPTNTGTLRCILHPDWEADDVILERENDGQTTMLEAATQSPGEHVFKNIQAGAYRVFAILTQGGNMSILSDNAQVMAGETTEIMLRPSSTGSVWGKIQTDKPAMAIVIRSDAEKTSQSFMQDVSRLFGAERIPDGFSGMVVTFEDPKSGVIDYAVENLTDGRYSIFLIQFFEFPFNFAIEQSPNIIEEFEIRNGEAIELYFEF